MVAREGSIPKIARTGSSRNPNSNVENTIEIDGNDENDRRTPINQKI